MSNNPANACSGTEGPQGATARKLIQAAALAAVLVPLGSVAVETATIVCVTSQVEGSCSGTGSYSGGAGEQSNTWKFFTDDTFTTLIYAFTIEGTPVNSFELDVSDVVVSQGFLEDTGALEEFPDAICIPTFSGPTESDPDGLCGLFDVFYDSVNVPVWDEDGFYATISWFANDSPLSQPDDLTKYILQAEDEFGGTDFSNMLTDTSYDPAPPTFPNDPALGGRGDSFSRFGGFVEVPEPATLLLFGSGVAAALYRRRRSKIH